MARDDKTLQGLYDLPLLEKKVIQELHDIAGMVAYDGVVDDNEIAFLKEWLARHSEYGKKWPFSKLFNLLEQVMEDGKVDDDERLQLLMFLSGISTYGDEPLCDRNPEVAFPDKRFLFLGQLEIARADQASQDVTRLKGTVTEQPDSGLDYLVLGNLGHANWKESAHAAVIQQVLDNRAQGTATAIISEAEFVRVVVRSTRA